jgi:4-alpha-glucanotransferase
LPIGVDKASVDTWMYPDLFRMNTSTGAPPDDFDPNGQNWGFPTYNWDNMAKDGYGWWRGRMTHLERYFSAMRIDHVLGFFRIWELPATTRVGLMGRFRPSVPIRRHELDSRGLWFIDRLCEPHITSRLLNDVFGDRQGEAAGRFLEETGSCGLADGGTATMYRFKTEFETEEGLLGSDAFKVRAGSPDWLVAETEAMRKGLLSMQHNVCLLRDPEDADAFYPRIEMEKTRSFQELEEWARHALSWLYNDYFNDRQDSLWRENARRTLPALVGCTGQLVCGEDLGMVPSCVPPVLEELGILGLRIQRMPFEEGEFGRPSRYPYETVCSPSCHDTTTTRAWYEADAGRRARYAKNVLGMTGDGRLASSFPPPMAYRKERVEEGSGSVERRRRTSAGSVGSADLKGVCDIDGRQIGEGLGDGGGGGGGRFTEPQHPPPDKCEPHVMRAIIRQHMASPAALAVFPAQDLLVGVGFELALLFLSPIIYILQQITKPPNTDHQKPFIVRATNVR